MTCNVGNIDRMVRALSAVIVIAVALLFIETLVPKIILLAASVFLLLSAWFGVCYVYRTLGFDTAKPKAN